MGRPRACSSTPTRERGRRSATTSRPWTPGAGCWAEADILRRDATSLGARSTAGVEPFDVAFLDPPYGQGYGESALAALGAGGWLTAGAICVLEQGAGEPDTEARGFTTLDARRYGAARIRLLRWSPGPG